ncbi:ead/Ea22-like family protein [Salmonella enterica]|uniref:Ead/Ea22-like family protein n=1 Tax=Salmonella enterica subsp. enterica serovar Javiana TaxID=363569 RepID=A0A5W4BMK9_SALET|nr:MULTISPECIES: ead/Ea22-like family protein [unclassified Salmonella]EAA9099119.1 ead/Ea22-like family protein [Salmonella enterica]EBR8302771.1 ead/Ea22-like family protein [Salmonella enterica subsp. enterica serovar Javiana]EBW8377308.1 ead/Ea22-like family protein [Salmonella enterica subsp. enterica serovar Panama]ECC3368488.1 ead/Ea22-like family protein [Salmonella enterica subsp. enterica]ECD2920338.1 ead/Ea22-like family protein [Salmonella enterica subsp. enterica serovar Lexington
MSNIDKQALREVAEKATKGPWTLFSDIDTKTFSIHTPRDKRCENVIKWGGFDCQPNAEANAEFIAAFNPKVALALLDELEHYKSREERVTKLVLDNSASWDALYKKVEAAEKHIAELEARKVNLSKLSVGEVMHMSGFSRDYAEGWCAGNDNAIHEIRTAGIKVKE